MMNKPVAIFSIFMSLVFIGLGILVLIRPAGYFLNLDPNMVIVLGSMIIAYGIFRFYRAYKVLKQK